jgi:hypothetical protein
VEGEWWLGNRMGESMWYQKCIYMYANTKMIPVEIILGLGEGEIKESGGGDKFKYDTFDTLQEFL